MKASFKKNILIGIAALAGLLLLAALGFFLYFESQFTVYQDFQNQFSIKYPKTWRVIRHPRPHVAVVFLRPKDTALDELQENFTVVIQPIPDDITTVAAFSGRAKAQLTAVFGTNIKIVVDKAYNWGWREGHLMIFNAPNPEHLKMVNAWTFRNTDTFMLSFLGDMNKYSQDGLIVQEMIRSLQLQ